MKLFIASGIFHPEPGGPATYLNELLPHLVGRGWDVRVLSYSAAPYADRQYPYPVTRILRRSLPLRLIDYARAARPLLAWADVVYVHTLRPRPIVTPRVSKSSAMRRGRAVRRADRADRGYRRYQTHADFAARNGRSARCAMLAG
jgi:glycosyltransferase involved in cell wall biosynthesis